MGAAYSHCKGEYSTWGYHCLLFDGDIRESNLHVLDRSFPNNSEIYLAKQHVNFGGLMYHHYFITDTREVHFLELSNFGQTSDSKLFYETKRVQVNTLPHMNNEIIKTTKVTTAIKERMVQVMGMCNFSLCLRNSEQVANYIFSGEWMSLQMEAEGALLQYFGNMMNPIDLKKVNVFPSTILPTSIGGRSSPKLYSMIDKQYTPTSFQYYSDGNKDSYNILVVGKDNKIYCFIKSNFFFNKNGFLGPTGAGKSKLVNVLFNTAICDSKISHESVTRDVCFIEGKGEIFDLKTSMKQTKKIVIADTVGLCDTELEDKQLFKMLKGRVSINIQQIDAVFIVFKADRLLKEHVKNITKVMEWLQYDKGCNYLNFLFVATFSENLNQEEKDELKIQARKMLKLKDTKIDGSDYESLVYVGFPKEDQLNDNGKEQVKASWELLQPLVRVNDTMDQLKGYELHVEKENAWNNKIRLPRSSEQCTIL